MQSANIGSTLFGIVVIWFFPSVDSAIQKEPTALNFLIPLRHTKITFFGFGCHP
jgi:hypothetical protein